MWPIYYLGIGWETSIRNREKSVLNKFLETINATIFKKWRKRIQDESNSKYKFDLFDWLYPINVKTDEPIGHNPNFELQLIWTMRESFRVIKIEPWNKC